MSRSSTPRARRRERDVIVEGEPGLAVADEERDALEGLVAELLIATLERDEGAA